MTPTQPKSNSSCSYSQPVSDCLLEFSNIYHYMKYHVYLYFQLSFNTYKVKWDKFCAQFTIFGPPPEETMVLISLSILQSASATTLIGMESERCVLSYQPSFTKYNVLLELVNRFSRTFILLSKGYQIYQHNNLLTFQQMQELCYVSSIICNKGKIFSFIFLS